MHLSPLRGWLSDILAAQQAGQRLPFTPFEAMRTMGNLPMLLLLLPSVVCGASAGGGPRIEHIGMVAAEIVGITVHGGHAEYGRQIPYKPQAGDQVDRKTHQRWVRRNGKFIGGLVGKDEKLLYTPDRRLGPKLDTAWADRTDSYRVSSTDDSNYREPVAPIGVHRKSKPTDFARVDAWRMEAPMEHVLYLRLPKPLVPGKRYEIAFGDGRLPTQSLAFDPSRLRSEAVHVTHLGFRPDDPVKVAFLSCWTGTGGPLAYREGLPFRVIDEGGKAVLQGKTTLSKKAGVAEDVYKKDYTGASVYAVDFSSLDAPGTYRVVVDGIGCSHPFPIGTDVWRKAFAVSARGFYHQRSGIELGPPYTTFRRPRCFHPDDGVKVLHSTCPLMDSGNGLNRKDDGNFGNLNKGRTDQLVANAWGSYMDAGDWDRRIQHLDASRLLLELADLFFPYFLDVRLNIPESGDQVPDIINEALFNLDGYRRMQTPEGGIRGGIESSEHPRHGEGSWQESLTVMAYAPGIWSSHVYAGVAARAAFVLRKKHPKLAAVYGDSALRAMQWAEGQHRKSEKKHPHQVNDARNLAAIELLRLTGAAEWHKLFLATTVFRGPKAGLAQWQHHDQTDAAFVYVRTQRPGMDEAVRRNGLAAIRRAADERVAQSAKTGFRWTKDPWRPIGWGLPAAPDAVTLCRAHALTGEATYLRTAILACQFGAGANPSNLCYTTGLGHASPLHPLHIDSRITHQPPPPGLTVFGPLDVERSKNEWGQKLVNQFAHPKVEQWPSLEAFFDVFWYPPMCEFTIHQPMAANAYVWGYLAARR